MAAMVLERIEAGSENVCVVVQPVEVALDPQRGFQHRSRPASQLRLGAVSDIDAGTTPGTVGDTGARVRSTVRAMAHPRMYNYDDPYLSELRAICLALPEATEVEAWGRPTFRAGKMFAIFEGHDDHAYAVAFKPEPDERPALLGDRRFYVPPYHGAYGWLALDFTAREVDWLEVGELMESSYRQIALKRMLKVLDST